MDTKALVKLFIVVALAAAGTAGTQYVANDAVNFSAVFTAALAALVAGFQKSPINPSA